ncbi:MAG: response regulator [Lachnospiraceae bacterium]|nr:response regulator [Lachnospiraceae bacterium]
MKRILNFNNLGSVFTWILMCLIVLSVFVKLIMPKESDQAFFVNENAGEITDSSLLYKGVFYHITDDGKREEIAVPGIYPAQRGVPFVIETTLPEDYQENMIAIRSSQENIRIYIGNELRVDYDTKNTRPVGSQTTSRYVICNTGEEDAGKTLRIEFCTKAIGYAGKVNPVFACDKYDFWNYMFESYGIKLIVAFVVVLVGLFSVCVGIMLRVGFKHRFNLEYLGWLVVLAGAWQVASSEIRQFFVENVSILSYWEFIVIMMAPIPFALYMNSIQKERYEKYYKVFAYCGLINTVAQIILQIFDVVNFIDMLVASHIILGAAILFVIVTFIWDYRAKHIQEYKHICFSMLIFMICVAISCLAIYFVMASPNVVVAIGVIQFVGVAIYQTIADVRVLENERRRIKAEKNKADQANKAKSQFLANMSHEIRTPINAILGMNTMVLRKSSDTEVRKYAEDIQSAGRSLLSIVNDILDFSKIESGKMSLIYMDYDYPDLINDVYNMVTPRAKDKGLKFTIEIDENIPSKMIGDDLRIKQVLVNLLTNAVKYTPEGEVKWRATLKKCSDENMVIIHNEITDTGIGIKPEDLSKLTEEFVRIEESRNRNIEGTGIGINIVVNLLRLMESKLDVKSVYGKGSTFSFDLKQQVINPNGIGKLDEIINATADTVPDYKVEFRITSANLLVVDDNAMNRKVFSSLLSEMGCRIDEADSGAKCLELVKKNKYDIIFMDHMMPDMDGVETFNQMKEWGDYLNFDTPVVILTANAISGAKEEYLAEGFTDYMSKPIDPEKLESMIEKLIPEEKKDYTDGVMTRNGMNTEVNTLAENANNTEVDENTAGISESAAGNKADGVKENAELPAIDGVDWKTALSNLKNEAILLETVKGFSATALTDLKTLLEMYKAICALENKEATVNSENKEAVEISEGKETFDAYRIKVHSMKANVATIGANHLAGLAKYLEYAARDYNLETINNLMPLFVTEWKKLKSIVDEVFGFANNEGTPENLKKMAAEDLIFNLDALTEAMNESDLDRADAVIEELSEYGFEKEQNELFEELKAHVMNIDTQNCVKVIDSWKALVER